MKKEELLKELRELQKIGDIEREHDLADKALVEYINDPEIKEA